MRIMFDANAFDKILERENENDLERIIACKDNEYFITSIQKKELENIPNEEKKRALLSICNVVAQSVPTPAVVGYAKVDDCVVLEEDDVYSSLLFVTGGNVKDAMIGSAAKREGCVVITNDTRFSNKLAKNGIPTKTYEVFIKDILLKK